MNGPSARGRDGQPVQRRAVRSLFSVFEEICDGAISVDAEARVVWINQKYRELLGVPPGDDVLGQPVEEIIPESRMRDVVTTGQPILLDIMRFGRRHFVVSRLPLKDDDGSIIGAVGFVLYDKLAYLKPFIERFEGLQRRLSETERRLVVERRARYSFANFVGTAPAVVALKRQALRAARMREPILLLGETGTGKELLAQSIHTSSPRSERPFVAVNVAALPASLIESELFGYAPGSFTGSDKKGRLGKFGLADGGTLFLDEIGDLPFELQAKLLRVLEEYEIEAVGADRMRRVDVRLIAASSRDLKAMVEAGRFRDDLYFRLNVLTLKTTPLRERLEDLPALCEQLIGEQVVEQGGEPRTLTRAAIARLARHRWPGNVRELRNVLARLSLLSDARVFDAADVEAVLEPSEPSGERMGQGSAPCLSAAVAALERRLIEEALAASAGSKSAAARRLGISRSKLYDKLTALGLSEVAT
ncbi:MAG: PAS domain-containing protein [Geminicoccaceae bacterium]|nr:MAG: PAS domain-containing protein [Geminicoccaceae bacterium]